MTSKPAFLEIACFNYASALAAQAGGADRIELCSGRAHGGLSPSPATLLDARQPFSKPLFVMVRPRAGDFVYNAKEFEDMKADIIKFKPSVDGFVFGVLRPDHRVDQIRNAELVVLAKPLPCTFHRAFDGVAGLEDALEDVIRCGFETVLTSGGAVDAMSGVEIIGKLVQQARGRIVIMPGGGVRSANIQVLKEGTRAEWYHSAAIMGDDEDAAVAEVQKLKESLLIRNGPTN